jgi:uncharacterized protein
MKNSQSLQPTTQTDRMPLLDALRGFALLGVLLANLNSFAQSVKTEMGEPVESIAHILIDTKFITLLTVLFGAGFYYQWKKAADAGIAFRSFYGRRMFWLFVIGSVHAHLFWYGDILRVYAMTGALLLLFPINNNKAMLRWAIIFTIPLTAIAFIAQQATPYFTDDYPTWDKISNTIMQGSYRGVLSMNWAIDPIRHFLKDSVLTLVASLGKALLGVWLAQNNFFMGEVNELKVTRVWLWSGLIFGVPSSITLWALQSGRFEIDSPFMLWIPFVVAGGLVLHALFYLAAFMKWFQRNRNFVIARLLIATGRMTLTNYLIQTIIGIGIFYGMGFGLAGKLGYTIVVLFGLVFFALQMTLSAWWLSRFKAGPVEWLWRRLTY